MQPVITTRNVSPVLIRSSSLDTVHSIDRVSGGSFILTTQIDILQLRHKNGLVVVVAVVAAVLVLVVALVVVVTVAAAVVEDVLVVAPAMVVMIMLTSKSTSISSINTLFVYFNCSYYYTGSMLLRASHFDR